MKVKKTLCLLLAAVMIVSLSACGKKTATYNDAGYYEIFSSTSGGDVLSRGDYDAMGWLVWLKLNPDGTGVLHISDGEEHALFWHDGTITMDDESVQYALAGGMLTLDLGGSSEEFVMILKKTEKPSYGAAGEENGELTESAAFEPVGGDLKGCHLEIVAAERFSDVDGNDAIRFYYDVTNKNDYPVAAWNLLSSSADEDGYKLVYTWASSENDVPEYGNDDLLLLPGVTIRCVCEFNFNPSGREVTVTFTDMDEQKLSAVFDAQALPGRPGDWIIQPVTGAIFYPDMGDEAINDGAYFHIDNAELDVEDPAYGFSKNEGHVIRVFFDYTNQLDDASYFTDTVMVNAFQDGIQIMKSAAQDPLSSDDMLYDSVEPGESLRVSQCWALRSDSPVVVVISEYWNNEVICISTYTLTT